jgi:hypothetical protein
MELLSMSSVDLMEQLTALGDKKLDQVGRILAEFAVNLILETPEYKKLQTIQNDFDLFSLFEDVLVENAWSRLFAFLLDSRRNHNLGTAVFRSWLKLLPNSPVTSLVSAFSTRVYTEWGTEERRRIDIVIEVLSPTRQILGVVGVENKIWSGEQESQVADYQKALTAAYPGKISKAIVFLSPDGRQSTTACATASCPCIAATHSSIANACATIPPSSTSISHAISAMCAHLRRTHMTEDAKSLVAKLYEKPAHRIALKFIAANLPTVAAAIDMIPKTLKDTHHIESKCEWKYGLHEFNFSVFNLNELIEAKKVGFYYMLLSESRPEAADIGDAVTVRLMLHVEKDTDRRKSLAEAFRKEMPASKGNFRQWGPWENIWVGESYVLEDFGHKDVEGMAKILAHGIDQTYSTLKRTVEATNKVNR